MAAFPSPHRWPLALLPVLLAACLQENPGESPPASTFAAIQARIFEPRCVQCHRAGEDFAEESGLILNGEGVYEALVDKPSKQELAHSEDLPLVSPGHPDRSFLYRKLLMAISGDSLGDSGKDYGHPMPFGKKPLSNGHVEYVRQWILAGAPKAGHVADTSLLRDTVPGRVPEFQPLAPPAPGEGYQIGVGKFPLPPNFEREFFVYKPLGNDRDIFVNRIKIKMRPGSHHFLLYRYDLENPVAAQVEPEENVFRELRNIDGSLNIKNMTALGEFAYVVAGTQVPEDEVTFPAGVVMRFPAGVRFDFNSHYVNFGDEVAYGEVAANLYTVDSAAGQHEALSINMGNTGFILPPGKTTVVTSNFPVKDYVRKHGPGKTDSMHIVSLFSHTHKLGKIFQIVVRGGKHNGEILYVNDDWHHPPYKLFDPPVILGPNDTLSSVVTYANDTPDEVRFGFKSTDEMDIIFGAWY